MPVVLVDIDLPFGTMVEQLVRWSIAAIPAMLILMVAGFFAIALLSMIFGGLLRH